jgi:predicted metalloprotease with PDZ domain
MKKYFSVGRLKGLSLDLLIREKNSPFSLYDDKLREHL